MMTDFYFYFFCYNVPLLPIQWKLYAYSYVETASEDWHHESWDQQVERSHSKHYNQQTLALPTQLPVGADLPSCTGMPLLMRKGW